MMSLILVFYQIVEGEMWPNIMPLNTLYSYQMPVKLYYYFRLEELLQLVLDVCNVLDLNKLVYTICTTILDITHASRYSYLDNRYVAKYVTMSFLFLLVLGTLLYSLCSSLHCSTARLISFQLNWNSSSLWRNNPCSIHIRNANSAKIMRRQERNTFLTSTAFPKLQYVIIVNYIFAFFQQCYY